MRKGFLFFILLSYKFDIQMKCLISEMLKFNHQISI